MDEQEMIDESMRLLGRSIELLKELSQIDILEGNAFCPCCFRQKGEHDPSCKIKVLLEDFEKWQSTGWG